MIINFSEHHTPSIQTEDLKDVTKRGVCVWHILHMCEDVLTKTWVVGVRDEDQDVRSTSCFCERNDANSKCEKKLLICVCVLRVYLTVFFFKPQELNWRKTFIRILILCRPGQRCLPDLNPTPVTAIFSQLLFHLVLSHFANLKREKKRHWLNTLIFHPSDSETFSWLSSDLPTWQSRIS